MPSNCKRFRNRCGSLSSFEKELGVKASIERRRICRAGIELCVLTYDDIVYILRDAVSELAAQRRLNDCIQRGEYGGVSWAN